MSISLYLKEPAGFTPHADEVLYLDFEDSDTIDDESVENNDSWSVIESGNFSDVLTTSDPKYGTRCLEGNGTRGIRHAITSSLSLGGPTEDFTIQFWFYPKSTQPAMANGYVPIFGGDTYQHCLLYYRPSGVSPANAIHWYEQGIGGTYSTVGLTIDAWNHIRVVRTGSEIFLFIDGQDVSPAVNSTSVNLTTEWSDTTWSINGLQLLRERVQSRYCNGKIDAFQILSSSLGTSNFTPEERTGA